MKITKPKTQRVRINTKDFVEKHGECPSEDEIATWTFDAKDGIGKFIFNCSYKDAKAKVRKQYKYQNLRMFGVLNLASKS